MFINLEMPTTESNRNYICLFAFEIKKKCLKKREREREMTEIKEIMHKLMNRLGFFVYNSTRKM